MEKLYAYEHLAGRGHLLKQDIRSYYEKWREEHPLGLVGSIQQTFTRNSSEEGNEGYMHVFRKKSRKELVRISAAVMGIEFSYAAETAFVSPTLLKIGVDHKRMTLVWALSPLIGFFLTPILGSLSDRCTLPMGRRRPFIILMSIGVIIGLILVPNGEYLGYVFGDYKPPDFINSTILDNITFHDNSTNDTLKIIQSNYHPWGVFLTVLGTVLLDFNADGCQSPARAYLLDITVQEDHAKGLSTFTIMAGLGGFFGYALGGIDWDNTAIGEMLGGHVRAVFTLITVLFIICVIYTITSFQEIPLSLINDASYIKMKDIRRTETQNGSIHSSAEQIASNENDKLGNQISYGTTNEIDNNKMQIDHSDNKTETVNATDNTTDGNENNNLDKSGGEPSFSMYMKSIIYMPNSLRILCLTNLFCWMAHVCYSLYFTDFVGEAVFLGNPTALPGSESRELYEQGVRFGCWGMSLYSLSCACYSLIIEKLISRYRAKKVYVYGLLTYSTGMFFMALSRHKFGVIVFSWTAGVMYSTLFTMPFILISQYHEKGQFDKIPIDQDGHLISHIRGLGTDVALVQSMVFLAQFILSLCMGTIVSLARSTTAVVAVASALSFFGAISASQVMYLDE